MEAKTIIAIALVAVIVGGVIFLQGKNLCPFIFGRNIMKQQKTVESRVLEILKECPMSRYDDMLLILHYYNQYGYIPAGNLPLEDIVFNYRAYGLPCFETIRRARQRVQSLFPEYSRNPQKEEQSGSISIVINIS